ncbi:MULTISPECIES: hypothetical protein [Virgibacillus]|nr:MULTISPECIES: hypothetical protein [Virgibacillus]MEB5454663.1 hypothetical protein [Virgibacillus pantothenticus]MEB5468662.1 hypothetical protein [Virgibacillus pantothenticus]MED3736189.1 hypothetical protein [Virgibacillus pantothenticus]
MSLHVAIIVFSVLYNHDVLSGGTFFILLQRSMVLFTQFGKWWI